MFIREMSLVYLILEFEQFLSRSLQIIYNIYPQTMKSSQKQITYDELFSYASFDEIKDKLSEREADIIVNSDIEKINQYLNERCNIDLSTNAKWKQFTEIFYRRNIIIHNNCYTNDTYRHKAGYKGKNTRLGASKAYILNALTLFEEYSKLIKDNFITKYT